MCREEIKHRYRDESEVPFHKSDTTNWWNGMEEVQPTAQELRTQAHYRENAWLDNVVSMDRMYGLNEHIPNDDDDGDLVQRDDATVEQERPQLEMEIKGYFESQPSVPRQHHQTYCNVLLDDVLWTFYETSGMRPIQIWNNNTAFRTNLLKKTHEIIDSDPWMLFDDEDDSKVVQLQDLIRTEIDQLPGQSGDEMYREVEENIRRFLDTHPNEWKSLVHENDAAEVRNNLAYDICETMSLSMNQHQVVFPWHDRILNGELTARPGGGSHRWGLCDLKEIWQKKITEYEQNTTGGVIRNIIKNRRNKREPTRNEMMSGADD